MKFDLHCHSNASDGKLSPQQVMALAEQAGLNLFALTDHDTLQGYQQIYQQQFSCQLISGIELSSVWAGTSIHIIGLDFDHQHPAIAAAIDFLRQAREARARIISEKLAKLGMPGALEGALTYCPDIGQVGRPHFAEFLLEKGYIKTRNEAFDRWLGNGKIGDVKTGWPSMQQAVEWITASGGIAVLAHPLRYKMTFTKLRLLVQAFVDAGGKAVEITGQQAQPDQLKSLQKLISQHGLAASGGSDFHDPEWAWAQIGKLEPLPDEMNPVWTLFKHSKINRL